MQPSPVNSKRMKGEFPQPAPNNHSPMSLPVDTEFNTEFANKIARMEAYNKHHYRPNSYLHKWWARRCGSTFRLILKGLVQAEVQQDYYAAGGLEGKIILDPMMGGGTTLHEALRLGANVIGADIDPIPILQARATLATVPLPELEQAYQTFYEALRGQVAPYFATKCPQSGIETTANYILYGVRRVRNGRSHLIVDSLILRIEADGRVIKLCPFCHAIIQQATAEATPCPFCNDQPQDALPPILEKGAAGTFVDDHTLPYFARYTPLVIVGRSPQTKKLFFKSPDEADLVLLRQANAEREQLPFAPADFVIEQGRKSRQLHARNIHNYRDLFSSRQLIYLHRAIQLLPQFDPDIRLNLALIVSTSLEFNSMLCGYKGKNKRRAGAIRHTFSHHAYSFPYTALENNPVYPRKASGTLQKLFQARIRNGRIWAQAPRERKFTADGDLFMTIEGEKDEGVEIQSLDDIQPADTHRFLLQQGSSTTLNLPDDSVDYIVTDPPYYDSVQYSDLSNFFRVWLRHLLPDDAFWAYDLRDSAVDPHKLDRESRYTELMTGIFMECQRVLRKENGRLIFTFHHWNPKGWAALTIALQKAGFQLVNRYVVYSENPISVHISNMNALLHDTILVLAPVVAEVKSVVWKRPSSFDLNDSEQFCHDCGTMLGYLLQQNLADDTILRAWQTMIAAK